VPHLGVLDARPLIGKTKTATGLKVKAIADQKEYRTERRVSDAEFKRLHVEKDDFHGDWNYVIRPANAEPSA
jgi:hypothetical protein